MLRYITIVDEKKKKKKWANKKLDILFTLPDKAEVIKIVTAIVNLDRAN